MIVIIISSLAAIGFGVVFFDARYRGKKRERRNVKGIQLTPQEWRLLRELAIYQRTSQQALISRIVKDYLQSKKDER